MPRTPKKGERCRLTIETSTEVRSQMQRLRDETDADSLIEVIRRSLNVYEVLLEAKKDGSQVILKKDGKEREVIIL